MQSCRRIYVEKKAPYAVRAKELKGELMSYLDLKDITDVRVLVRYDIENISTETYNKALGIIFSEPPLDILYEETCPSNTNDHIFSVEFLPGQFDQRADSAEQCVKLLNEKEDPIIKTATTYIISGSINNDEMAKIKAYCINPVDSRETDEVKPKTLVTVFDVPEDVKILKGFTTMPDDEFKALYSSLGLAMTFRDFGFIKQYFINSEKRDPSMTEIRVLDTYWSDHCRHTTFLTELTDVKIKDGFYKKPIEDAFLQYKEDRKVIYKDRTDKYISLMDIALLAMKKLRAEGKLNDMEVSDEINACSIVTPVTIDGKTEEWLVFFKNETHNHPTEIEPFGGAATCLGGAIRDPLSGRGYVYQAMRVTGAADPTASLKDTLKGKLPQRKLTTGAAKGYSSYGNQIGLSTGLVDEIYHPNYVAKRMEIGAVMGAAPRKNVKRENSDPGDIIILMGGRTGRDGCGGATGSSKVHTTESIEKCGAEVQKGNAPTERKLQRLFRRAEVSSLIKKCNDFGAGGVSVAIGELADGLKIYLDKVPKKYAGLDGTELAISESQERMAVVVDKKDVDKMLAYAESENLEAVVVAEVMADPRLIMYWRDKEIVNISRHFLDTNGAHQEAEVTINLPDENVNYFTTGETYKSHKQVKRENAEGTKGNIWSDMISDLNICSKRGLVEQFDGSIGTSTVLMPYGGKTQLTPIQTMVAKLPVLKGDCKTATMMSYGFDPYLSSWSPFHGAVYAIISSVSKIVAAGGDMNKIRFTFQEYFKKLGTNSENWGEPMAALLGAYDAQLKLGLPSIGGKDSMSGTFNDIDVPPTLVSFAVDIASSDDIISPEFKNNNSTLVLVDIKKDNYNLPDYDALKELYSIIHNMITDKKVLSAYAVGMKGIAESVMKMSFGNMIGAELNKDIPEGELFKPSYGAVLLEVDNKNADKFIKSFDGFNKKYSYNAAKIIGKTLEAKEIKHGETIILLEDALEKWTDTLEGCFPTKSKSSDAVKNISNPLYDSKKIYVAKNKVAKPKVFIPVFPGTNCEYDSIRAFERAGAEVESCVFKNMNERLINESVESFVKAIKSSQMIMFPGGFSAGDEPDGSGKFIATAFKNARISDAVNDLLKNRDGLILGICNGFQAIIKLGLLTNGEISGQDENSPTLAMNVIGRHISRYVNTKVVTNKTPWLMKAELGGVYSIPISHGEGRFVANDEWLKKLSENGQICTQYVDMNGNPTMDEQYNPNGSYMAIEGITSPDGRVFGKMAHSERKGCNVAINITGEKDQKIFESGVEYYK